MFKKLKVDAEQRRIWAVDGGLNGNGAGHLLSRTWLATCVYRFGRYANEIEIKLFFESPVHPRSTIST